MGVVSIVLNTWPDEDPSWIEILSHISLCDLEVQLLVFLTDIVFCESCEAEKKIENYENLTRQKCQEQTNVNTTPDLNLEGIRTFVFRMGHKGANHWLIQI